MSERVNLGKSAPALYQSVIELDRLASEALTTAGISEGFSHLLRLRASQINQCAFCVRLHARDALSSGESSDRVAVLAAWKETEYFTPRERAALELVEAVTLISEGQLPDAIYEQAAPPNNVSAAAVATRSLAANCIPRPIASAAFGSPCTGSMARYEKFVVK